MRLVYVNEMLVSSVSLIVKNRHFCASSHLFKNVKSGVYEAETLESIYDKKKKKKFL